MKDCTGIAFLSNEGVYTSFQYKDINIRFRTSDKLEKYTRICEWDNGYIVVMAKYTTNAVDVEDYIDLIPVLENLYIDPEEFLKPIVEVRIKDND